MADISSTFNFELVSPERKLMSEPVWQVVVPGEEGYFGVRAGHMSLMASVKPGVVEIWASEGAAPERIFIAGGFADVTAKNCTILAEEAVNVNDLDAADLEQQLRNLNEDLGMTQDAAEKSRVQRRSALVQAKLDALSAQKSA